MRYQEILQKVQSAGGLKDEAQTEKVLTAVLGTLGERVYRTEERRLAAQLPKELKEVFYQYQGRERGRGDLANYRVDEFYNRVKARAGISFQEAQRQSKIVLGILQEAVSPGEIEAVLKELPDDFHGLFQWEKIEPVAPVPPPARRVFEEYHLVHSDDGKWTVRRGERGEMIRSFGTKEQALIFADDLADPDRGDVLVIHNIDGSISKRETPSKATK